MAESVTRLRVLVASPGDTEEERARLDRVAAELNRGVGDESGIILDLVKWETHSRPGIGEDAQDVINRQLPEPDIVVGMFWRRLGTPTKRAASGTAEELQRALDTWRRSRAIEVLVYFSTAPYSHTRADVEQLAGLNIFRDYLEDSGLFVHEYRSPDEFEAKVREHLSAAIRDWKRSHNRGVSPKPPSRPPQSRRGEPEGWHEQLCSGSLAVELNARRRGDVHTLALVVREALREQKFRDAAPRAAAALTEVLINVARHTDPGAALVEIDVDPRFLRRVSIAVHDQGTGFDLERTLEDHYRGIERGEREHGLLLVSRLASNIIAERDEPPWQHVVSLDVYDPSFRPSPLFDHPMVVPLGIDYQENPEVYRLGPEVQVGDHFVKALQFGVDRNCRPLLGLYFEPLLKSGASHLGIDISAPERKRFDPDRVSSEVIWLGDTSKPGLFSRAVESYFQPFFDQQRVVVLIRGDPVLPDVPWRGWMGSRAARVFLDDEAACREYLDQLTAA